MIKLNTCKRILILQNLPSRIKIGIVLSGRHTVVCLFESENGNERIFLPCDICYEDASILLAISNMSFMFDQTLVWGIFTWHGSKAK